MKILITGASRGIGYATALILARAGHQVLAIARNTEQLEHLSREGGDLISTLSLDLSDLDKVRLNVALKELGGLDVLINNAGLLINKPFLELTQQDWLDSFQVNLFASVALVKECLPFLEKSKQAHIVNIGSMGGFQGSQKFPGLAAYSASKGALATFTESLAVELRNQKIAVNCLALGAVQTEMLEAAFPGYQVQTSSQAMGAYIATFSTSAQQLFNGKIIPVSLSNP
jgi:NAD(P)-dependent dehydrogenase (short-subunit alcohol dehydrogenase family)